MVEVQVEEEGEVVQSMKCQGDLNTGNITAASGWALV